MKASNTGIKLSGAAEGRSNEADIVFIAGAIA